MPDILPLRPIQPAPRESGPTVAEIVQLYLELAGRFLAVRTLANRQQILGLLVAELGRQPVASCRRSDLQNWLADHVEWESDSTRRGVVAAVQTCFNWAVNDERIDRNPFRGVTQQEGEPRRSMTDAEYQSMLRNTSALFRRVLVFQRFTGCRPCEMSALEWSHIDLEHGAIVLKKHKARKLQKTPRPRIIRLVPVALKLLAWIRRHGPAGDRVFVNARGTPWTRSNLSLRIQRIRARAGIPADCKLYGLRHQFGTMAIVNGLDLKTLAELMGHSSARTTERYYVHLATQGQHLRDAMEQAVRRKR